MDSIGKTLILFGIVLIVTGAFFFLLGKYSWIGRLPGDIIIKREGFTFYFPIVTMIMVSVILTILFNLLGKR